MRKFNSSYQRFVFVTLLICLLIAGESQAQAPENLKITNFAIWGGGATANPYSNTQGISLDNKVTITGSIGSNHLVEIKGKSNILNGSIYSGNGVVFGNENTIIGNITANRAGANFQNPVISAGTKFTITGNLTANGMIDIKSGTVTGQAAVPAPSATNYTGPVPSGGIVNTFVLPVLPLMPNNTPFDNQVAAANNNITTTRTITPGVYRKLALTGKRILTLKGPGSYIFYEVNNGSSENEIVFDFNNTQTGTINVFVIKDARWGNLTVSTKNGNFPSRIYTEVHGNGSTFGGFAFDLKGSNNKVANKYAWLGNVWVPNGSIFVGNTKASVNTSPHIIGALWSGKKVTISDDLVLSYQAPAADPSYIDPYYPPPASGKVDAPNNTIGSELFSLSQNPSPITSITQNEVFRFKGPDTVMIEVISILPNDNDLKDELMDLGMTGIINNGPHIYIITGYFPINNLSQLNGYPGIQYVRPLYPPLNNVGQVTSQGDITMRSNNVRDRFGLDGEGVKVGVLSDSYNALGAAQADVNEGDLPGVNTAGSVNPNPEPVQIVADLTGAGHDEGRAMLQIVHDVAPKAKLAFRTGFYSAGDFARGIEELAAAALAGGPCDVIVDDITYITEPFLTDGRVAQAVNQVVSQGVTYFSSAGNFGMKSTDGVFNGVTNLSLIPAPGKIHQFGPAAADIFQTVNLKPGSYTIVLQWNEQFHSLGNSGVQTADLDLYLVGSNGYTLFGFNRSNLFGDPFEVCPFTVTEETNAKLMVVNATGTQGVRFKYIIFRGNATIMDYQSGGSTIVGHPNAAGAIAVGAMLYANIPTVTPVWPGVASFSSRGGTPTLDDGNFITRNKPELVAPNGVNTTVNLGGAPFNDGDAYPNFFGTSASAPHAAAVAGLLIQGQKKYNLQTTVSPTTIRNQLQTSAGKFSNLSGNHTFEGGYGYIQADSAVAQIANARPIISELGTVVPGAQNGTEPFIVRVTGKYLTSNTEIYFNGEPVETTVSPDNTEATAEVPAIPNGEDPPIQLYNPPKSPSELDGGLSEALHFFSSVTNVTIRANSDSRKYGQNNPDFTAKVIVNGIPIEETEITLADLQLDGENLSFSTLATATSRAGLYSIRPFRTTPLDNEDPLLSQYSFTFVSGTLSVGKMALKITPENKIVKYGDDLGEVTYSYQFEESINATPELEAQVALLHKKFLADNALVVLNRNNSETNVSALDLYNMSMMASFQAVRNAQKFVLQNGQLVPLANTLDISQLGEQRFILNASRNSLDNYKQYPDSANMEPTIGEGSARGFLNLKSLANGTAKATLNGQLQPMVNGQLMAMVNGQLQAIVNGQLQALVNGEEEYVDAEDIVFRNGQLLALIDGQWTSITNGQLQAIANGENVTIELSVTNGQLQAIANGEIIMEPIANGQLQAIVNGQLLAIANGQLQALVNGQLMPMVNGQLVAMANGQLQPMVNGQLQAIVNGQLMVEIDDTLQVVTDLSIQNGQLQGIANGQLQPIANGQLQAMVNGLVTAIPNFALVNGQLQAIVNSETWVYANGQLQALVNGQLQPIANGDVVEVESARKLANGQLQALVNGVYIPIANGQLQAIANTGQYLSMVNGQLMAIANNGDLNFVVFSNEQLQPMANGQLMALVNGQLQPIANQEDVLVNGQLQAMVNGQLQPIANGQIDGDDFTFMVNQVTWNYTNGQQLPIVNGQLQPIANNFDVSGPDNNSNTVVLVDEDDINLQGGGIGGMFAMNMITGLNVGTQYLVPGAFVNENFEVTYGLGEVTILPSLLIAKADSATKVYGEDNPDFTISYSGFAYDDNSGDITEPEASSTADNNSGVGHYPIILSEGSAADYTLLLQNGDLEITKKALLITADDKMRVPGDPYPSFSITYDGLVGDDTEDSICVPFVIPPSPKVIDQLERRTIYSNVSINDGPNYINATPGQQLTLTGSWNESFIDPENAECPGCITQLRIGMVNETEGNAFATCSDVSGLGNYSGTISNTFNAPSAPGVYYITQISTWWYTCPAPNYGDPPQIPIHNNGLNDAIAVVVVNIAPEGGIVASSEGNEESQPGNYPITLDGCVGYNPNYEVTIQNGTLTVSEYPCTITGHIWKGNGNFDDEFDTGNGTPNGGVTANGEGLIGSNSFSFDGSTGFISTGTAGSVSGTGDFSVSAWVQTTSNNPMVIINQRSYDIDGVFGTGFNGEYILKIGGAHNDSLPNPVLAGRAYFLIYDFDNNADAVDLFSTSIVNDGNWHHIKAERIGTRINLYVDGSLEATALTAGVVNLSGDISTYIGADFRDNASYFNGLIDELRVSICTTLAGRPASNSKAITITQPNLKISEDKLYPNPSSNIVRLQLKNELKSANDLQVFDMNGRMSPVHARKLGEGMYELDVSKLAKGIYFIKAKTKVGIMTYRFVKM